MKLFGLLFLLLGALSLSREYSGYTKKRLAECEEFIAFIKHMRLSLKCFLKPPREIARTFQGDAIKPFLDMLEKEENMALAFEASKPCFSLSPEEEKVLTELFSSIGSCYAEDGVHLLEAAGIANCILLPFTAELSRLSAKEFMLLLRTEYNVRTLVIGYDHRFGHNRLESFEDYVRYGQELDIDIVQARAYTQENAKVSSSAIRELLSQGEVHTASRLLGYPYPLEGTVTDGYRVGRKIGFPTANLRVDHPFKLVPAEGVYAVKVEVEGQQHLGMLNIGHRPTLNNGADRSIEVHILDFAGDIYRQNIRIEFLRFLRPETKFASIEELISQIEKDKEAILKDSSLR